MDAQPEICLDTVLPLVVAARTFVIDDEDEGPSVFCAASVVDDDVSVVSHKPSTAFSSGGVSMVV
jgi:hypothetical protein